MHIPSSPIAAIEILPFREALDHAGGSGGYDPERWLYVPDFYTEYRYVLGTRGASPLLCVGINPSTAAPDSLDNTLKSVQRIAKANGYDSFLMVNVCAQRATRPQDLEREPSEKLHRENMAAFAYLLGLCPYPPPIWAAWGNIIESRPYLSDFVRDMVDVADRYSARWFTAGKRSVRGHPHHPLYLCRDTPLDPFDAAAYCVRCLPPAQRP